MSCSDPPRSHAHHLLPRAVLFALASLGRGRRRARNHRDSPRQVGQVGSGTGAMGGAFVDEDRRSLGPLARATRSHPSNQLAPYLSPHPDASSRNQTAGQAEMKDSSRLQMVAPRRIERRAPPPPPRPSRAAATAAQRVPLRAPCSRRLRPLLVLAAGARASRRRAPRAAARKSASVPTAVTVIVVHACARLQVFVSPPGGVAVRGREGLVNGTGPSGYFYAVLTPANRGARRTRATAPRAARLSGFGGGAPVHAQRRHI
jgi:hypothetical protein